MNEITRIPKRTWWGALLCRVGLHRWAGPYAHTTVIPTGNALLIKKRVEGRTCERLGCTARRERRYEREAI